VAHGPAGRNRHGVIPDDLPFDLTKIGEVLEQHNVRYLVIGGMSGAFHGMVDYRTKDVDLLVQNSAANLDCLAAALTQLGAVPHGTTDRWPIIGAELAAASTQWDTDAGPVDVLAVPNSPRRRQRRRRGPLRPRRNDLTPRRGHLHLRQPPNSRKDPAPLKHRFPQRHPTIDLAQFSRIGTGFGATVVLQPPAAARRRVALRDGSCGEGPSGKKHLLTTIKNREPIRFESRRCRTLNHCFRWSQPGPSVSCGTDWLHVPPAAATVTKGRDSKVHSRKVIRESGVRR
jgi:hypothetical protein